MNFPILINLAQFKRNIDEKSTLENLTLERVRETCEEKKKKYCDRWRIKIIEFKRHARVIHFCIDE